MNEYDLLLLYYGFLFGVITSSILFVAVDYFFSYKK